MRLRVDKAIEREKEIKKRYEEEYEYKVTDCFLMSKGREKRLPGVTILVCHQ